MLFRSGNPPCNLYNRAGLPASPFRVTTNAFVKTPFTVSGGAVYLTLNSSSNTTCWVDYKDDLTAPSWTPLFGPQTSTGASLVVTNYPAAVSNRFYRVNLWPY